MHKINKNLEVKKKCKSKEINQHYEFHKIKNKEALYESTDKNP